MEHFTIIEETEDYIITRDYNEKTKMFVRCKFPKKNNDDNFTNLEKTLYLIHKNKYAKI